MVKDIKESLVRMVVSDVLNERYGDDPNTTDITKKDIIDIVSESVNRVKKLVED